MGDVDREGEGEEIRRNEEEGNTEGRQEEEEQGKGEKEGEVSLTSVSNPTTKRMEGTTTTAANLEEKEEEGNGNLGGEIVNFEKLENNTTPTTMSGNDEVPSDEMEEKGLGSSYSTITDEKETENTSEEDASTPLLTTTTTSKSFSADSTKGDEHEQHQELAVDTKEEEGLVEKEKIETNSEGVDEKKETSAHEVAHQKEEKEKDTNKVEEEVISTEKKDENGEDNKNEEGTPSQVLDLVEDDDGDGLVVEVQSAKDKEIQRRKEEMEEIQTLLKSKSLVQKKRGLIWDRMPRELKPEIFWFLQIKELCSCLQFEQWDQLAWNHRKSLYLNSNKQVLTDPEIRQLCQEHSNLRILHITQCCKLTDASLRSIASSLFNLTRLHLSGCFQITDYGLQYFCQRLGAPNDFVQSPTTATLNHHLPHARSESVLLTPSPHESPSPAQTPLPSSMSSFFSSSSSSTSSAYYSRPTQASSAPSPLPSSVSARHTHASSLSSFFGNSTPGPASSSSLASLFSSSSTKSANTSTLHAPSPSPSSSPSTSSLPSEEVRKKNINLRSVELEYCHLITDYGMKMLASLRDLTSLSLSGLRQVSDVGIGHLARNLPSLTILHLSFCPKLTDLSIGFIIEGNKRSTRERLFDKTEDWKNFQNTILQDLKFSFTGKITDHALQRIAHGLPSLRSLRIEGSKHITDSGVRKLCGHQKNLKGLSLSHCISLTDESLKQIADNMKELNTLELEECTGITDLGVSRVLKESTQIRFLNVLGCTKVSEFVAHPIIGLPHLAESLRFPHLFKTFPSPPTTFSAVSPSPDSSPTSSPSAVPGKTTLQGLASSGEGTTTTSASLREEIVLSDIEE